jgi:hypothetical protein
VLAAEAALVVAQVVLPAALAALVAAAPTVVDREARHRRVQARPHPVRLLRLVHQHPQALAEEQLPILVPLLFQEAEQQKLLITISKQ